MSVRINMKKKIEVEINEILDEISESYDSYHSILEFIVAVSLIIFNVLIIIVGIGG
jgi:hypothetical protein